ncbi:MAG TPA: SH3 domain-containing protein [Acidobacteriaceae bacterium]|nr:SH3 domain-containing protein [Acidobacteriaceae bacterium]
MSPDSHSTSVRRRQFRQARWLLAIAAICGLIVPSGCSRFRAHSETQYVYVIAKNSILRDRVAAVSNRTGEVTNGEKLEVLERDRRFVKVKTPEGNVGWLETRLTADQALADQFDALRRQHQKDPVIASATARDDVYLHISPGRETDRFFRLSENDPVSLLERATVAKPLPPGGLVADAQKPATTTKGKPAPTTPPPPAMEDWWLVRGANGQTGWVYSHLIDVSVPDTLARYAEGQRVVGSYLLTTVNDPESGMLDNGQTVTSVPEYVAVLNSWQAGLPYDFDQVRVFIWNIKKHRYETSFREHNIEGYLPVKLFKSKDPYGKAPDAMQQLPTFSYNVLSADAPQPVPDPKTGEIKPAKVITKTYRLEGNICRRILPPNTPPPAEAHPAPEPKKEKKGRKR